MSSRAFRWLVVSALLVLVAVPLYWILDTSFKTGRQILMSEAIYLPRPFTIENYLYLFEETRFAQWLRNSTVVAVASTLISLAIGSAGAYALTRLRFPGRRTFGALVLITYLVPPGLMFIPLYRTFIQIGYSNSHPDRLLQLPRDADPRLFHLSRALRDLAPHGLLRLHSPRAGGSRPRRRGHAPADPSAVLVYIYLHKYMVSGLTLGAVKG